MVTAATVIPAMQTGVHADSYDTQIAALQAQADSLSQQISTLEQQSSSASEQAASVAQALAQTQAQTASAQQHLEAVNAQLQATSAQLQQTQAELAADRQQLEQLVVNMYKVQSDGSVTKALVDSQSFVDAMATITSVSQVSDKVKTLIGDVQTRERQLAALQAQQEVEYQQATEAVATLQSLGAQQNAQQQELQQEAGALSGQAATMAQQLQGIEQKIAQLRAAQAAARASALSATKVLGGALPPFANGARSDYFPWGQCTWYVASQRDVTWDGDAWQWAGTAAAAGMSEGMTPQVGSIVVWAPGGAYSGVGHVAYVVQVNGPRTFIVDEANDLGLGVVDRRLITTLAGVEAFIY